MMPAERVEILVSSSQEIIDRWADLAARRYGSICQENLDKVGDDALMWLIQGWERGEYGFYDWFWRLVAFHCPFKRIAAIGWGKLVIERYLDWR